jgi:polysaccharide biosynthesis protein PslG
LCVDRFNDEIVRIEGGIVLMRRGILAALVVFTAAVALLPTAQPTAAQSVPPTYPPYQVNYFPETQHSAVNWFWETWKNTPNALFVYGYPISQQFVEESPTNPGQFYRVQYFERAVLEEHPENFGQQGNRFYVLGRLMGSLLARGRENEPPFQPVADPGDGTYDPNTRHTLTNSPAPFRSFWLENGGLEVFGRPLSEQFQEVNQADGQTYWVQYFERQRMEWQPNDPNPAFRIKLGLLGTEYAQRIDSSAFDNRTPDEALPAQFIYGFNAHLYGQGTPWQDRNRALTLTKNAKFNWIRQQVAWEDLQSAPGTDCYRICWGELDAIVDDANAQEVNLLISVVRSPGWATANGGEGMPSRENFGEFANFMGQMAARYRGRVPAYQVWNEQNLAVENAGQVADANYYVDMLVAAYDAIKANDPGAIVVSGPPTSTNTERSDIATGDLDYYRTMFQNPNFRTHVDVIGAHPGGQLNPPDTKWPENPGPGPNWRDSGEFYFRRLEDVRQVMVENGLADRQIWVTEFGWATQNNTPGYEYGNSISQEQQAQYIVRAFEKGRREYAPWIGAMFLWNLNFAVPWQAQGNELHEQASFGVLNGDWSPRPSYLAIQQMRR